jgi:hypothetical protein
MEKQSVEVSEVKKEGLVWDGEKGTYIEVDPEVRKKASSLQTQLEVGSLITAVALYKIYSERLYVALGCSTKQEYVNTMLPFGERQAQRYAKVGEKWAGLLPNNMEDLPKLKGSKNFEDIANMGIKKLYEVARIEDVDFEEIVETGKIKTDHGEVLIEDVKNKAYREFAEQIKQLKKRSTAKITALEEKNKTLKAEKEQLSDKVKEADEKLRNSKEIEDRYGEKKQSMEEKRRVLDSAEKHLTAAGEKMANLNAELDDPLTFKKDVIQLYDKIHLLIDIFQDNYGEILLDMEDY